MRYNVFAFAAVAQASTFQSCEVPQFEWAAYGNRVTGRMYGMTAAVNDQHIFAAGYLKSTLDPEAAGFVESTADTPSQDPPLRTGTAAARRPSPWTSPISENAVLSRKLNFLKKLKIL